VLSENYKTPPNLYIRIRVLMMILWRQWFVLVRCHFLAAAFATINPGPRGCDSRAIDLIEDLSGILMNIFLVFVQSHRSFSLAVFIDG
jgi:hypothetical protein